MLKRFVPLLDWLPNYKRGQLPGDLSAGLTVGVMLIPQGMAYAMLAGLPPIYGLYASMIPLVIYAFFGTSRQLSVGPGAMIALLVASGVGTLAEAGTESYITLAILLSLMVGAIQLTLGLLKLGFIVNFLSRPVISGFTSAAAIIIGLSQLKHLFGIDIPRTQDILLIVEACINQLSDIHLPTMVLGAVAIAGILVLRRVNRAIPGPLVAVVFGILAVVALGLAEGGMKIVAEVPSGLPTPAIPEVSTDAMRDLLPMALTIALVGFMQSIGVAKAIQTRHKDYIVRANQEFIAIGLANIIGSLFKAFPVTGGLSRSAVNNQSGAKTGLASIISAVFIALTLIFLTPLFYYLPKAILAAVIMVAVFGLVDFKEARHLWKADKVDFGMMAATFLATLAFGIELGIATGVGLSLIMVIYRSASPHVAILGRLPGTQYYRNLKRFPHAEDRPDILAFRFDAQLYFANVGFFRDLVAEKVREKGPELRMVILNAGAINFLDSTAVHLLQDIVRDLKNQNIRFCMTAVKGPVRDTLFRSGLIKELGDHSLFMKIEDCIRYWDAQDPAQPGTVEDNRESPAYQTNVNQ